MPETAADPSFPLAMTMEQLRDYAAAHCTAGRGSYYPEVRSHYLVAPPMGDTHDDELRIVFFNGYY